MTTVPSPGSQQGSRRARLAGLVGSLLLGTGCHAALPTVTVETAPGAVQQMAGRWEGSYESEENGRGGMVQFELSGRGDTARGEVRMLPAPGVDLPSQGRSRGEPRDQYPRRSPVPLPIHFVRIEQGQVLGTLEPYIDPDCDCQVTTNFIGSVDGDEAGGIFAIRGNKTWLAYGEWRAHRVQKPTH